jgi:hypothetical protein
VQNCTPFCRFSLRAPTSRQLRFHRQHSDFSLIDFTRFARVFPAAAAAPPPPPPSSENRQSPSELVAAAFETAHSPLAMRGSEPRLSSSVITSR